jgi:hypothetical protein
MPRRKVPTTSEPPAKRSKVQPKVEEEEEEEGFDAKIKRYGMTVNRSTNGTSISFKHGSSQIRGVVQFVCGNIGWRNQKNPPSVVTLQDLWYALPLLKNLVVPDDPEEEDEDGTLLSPISKEVTEEERKSQALKRSIDQDKASYLCGQSLPSGLEELIAWIENETKDQATELLNTYKKKKIIKFESLGLIFRPGKYVVGTDMDTKGALIGYRVINAKYGQQTTREGKFRWFNMELELVVSHGTGFLIVTHVDTMPQFLGGIQESNFTYQLMTDDTKAMLTARGRRYQELAAKPTYLAYSTDSFSIHPKIGSNRSNNNNTTQTGVATFLRASGRAMVDSDVGRRLGHFPAFFSCLGRHISSMITNYHQTQQTRQNQQHFGGLFGHHNQGQQYETLNNIPEDMLCLCWPAITAFSFKSKSWGHVLVDGLSEIKFDEKAFDQLVLDASRKEIIRAMVKHSEVLFQDIISGKGGGSIFLLHGPPGVGKTLTAEAVAEMLHKPLYSVTMGELGTTPTELEEKLSDVFELAKTWDALVLMDEADIFLERRGQKEVIRNAMVGVLMRQIEYFQGVLFLTSNRVDVFDEAFHSRITVALKYEQLSTEVRKSVWEMLLKQANISGLDTNKLSQYPLNGRQIKNCICLAQGLAKDQNKEVTSVEMNQTIQVCMEFVNELRNINQNHQNHLN